MIKKSLHIILLRLNVIIAFLSIFLTACTTSTLLNENINPIQNAVNLEKRIDASDPSKSNSERYNKSQKLLILQSCRKGLRDNSEIAIIRKQIQSDLKAANVSENEIEDQLNLYDLRTCDLR